MISTALQQAIDALQIQDLYLRWSRSETAEGFRAMAADFSAIHVQQMQMLKKAEAFEADGEERLLRVSMLLGARWVLPDDNNPEPSVKALIEAEFVAEYRYTPELARPALDEFAQKNVIYHVWPYWREFVSSHAERLRLPRVTLPMLQLLHHRNGAADSDVAPI